MGLRVGIPEMKEDGKAKRKAAFFSSVLPLVLFMGGIGLLEAQRGWEKPYPISAVVGDTIDAEERRRCGLFPEVSGYQSAPIYRIGPSGYRVRIIRGDSMSGRQREGILQRGEDTIRSLRRPIIRELLSERGNGGGAVQPPVDVRWIIPELFLGGVGSAVGLAAAVTLLPGEAMEGGGTPSAWTAIVGLSALGSAGAVWTVGSLGQQTGSFSATLLGSVAGAAVGSLLGKAMNHLLPVLVCPPIGGVVGFNLTRKYKTISRPSDAKRTGKPFLWRVGCQIVRVAAPTEAGPGHIAFLPRIQLLF